MKCLFAIIVAATALLAPFPRAVAFFQEPTPTALPVSTDLNVNSRYRIEQVLIKNASTAIPRSLQREFDRLIGTLYRTDLVDELESRIRKEFPGFSILRTVSKGDKPDQIRVSFELERLRKRFDLSSPKLVYHSQQNFTLGADLGVNVGPATVTYGFVTDNNERLERYSGFRGGLSFQKPNSRFRLALLTESYRAQWDQRTARAAGPLSDSLLYRSRNTLEPSILIDLTRGFELRAGLSFTNLEFQFPAARNQATNAVTSTLRYSKQWELGSSGTSTLEAGYHLRAAASPLGSDYDYRRHLGEVSYVLSNGAMRNQKIALSLSALLGGIDGNAPLADRFVLGNANTLRGWNRFAIAPLGGDRVVHFSADGRYRILRLVYDTGTIYNTGKGKTLRHSLAAGVVISGLNLMVACPLKGGSVEPVFLAGINF